MIDNQLNSTQGGGRKVSGMRYDQSKERLQEEKKASQQFTLKQQKPFT
jgi:hypothetical protein